MTNQEKEEHNLIVNKAILKCEMNIERAFYTQGNKNNITEMHIHIYGIGENKVAIDVPQSLYCKIGKLIIDEYIIERDKQINQLK